MHALKPFNHYICLTKRSHSVKMAEKYGKIKRAMPNGPTLYFNFHFKKETVQITS